MRHLKLTKQSQKILTTNGHKIYKKKTNISKLIKTLMDAFTDKDLLLPKLTAVPSMSDVS